MPITIENTRKYFQNYRDNHKDRINFLQRTFRAKHTQERKEQRKNHRQQRKEQEERQKRQYVNTYSIEHEGDLKQLMKRIYPVEV